MYRALQVIAKRPALLRAEAIPIGLQQRIRPWRSAFLGTAFGASLQHFSMQRDFSSVKAESATGERTLPPVAGVFSITIPTGRTALVLSPWGAERIVNGPCTMGRLGSTVRMFRHYVVPAGDKVVVWDQYGQEKDYQGPVAVNVHPDASIFFCPRRVLDADQKVLVIDKDGEEQVLDGPCVFHVGPRDQVRDYRLVRLANNEAVCVVRQNGAREIVFGSSQPKFFLDPREKLHRFSLTGGGDADGLGKLPGALQFEMLRLQPSQGYFAFPVRTADNAVLIVKLMVFLEIKHPERFILSDDPFAVMFNFIMAEATSLVGSLSFDAFKQQPGSRLQEHFVSTAGGRNPLLHFLIDQYGLDVSKVVLRGWMAEDRQVQKILDQAAAAQTQRDVERAEHALKLEQLDNEREQLESAAKNHELIAIAAEAKGRQEGLRIASMYKAVESAIDDTSNGNSNVADLVRALVAGQAVGSGGGKLQIQSKL